MSWACSPFLACLSRTEVACVDPAVMSGRTKVSNASAFDIGREREVIRAYAVLEIEDGQKQLEYRSRAEHLMWRMI